MTQSDINLKFALVNTLSALVIGSKGAEVKPFAYAVRFAHNAPVSKLQTTSSCRLFNASHLPSAPAFSSSILLPSIIASDVPSNAKFGIKDFIMKTVLATIFLSISLSASFSAKISPITPTLKQRMVNGGSYRAGCPVGLKSLRYLNLTYIGFDGKEHKGEMIVNKDVANEVVAIFKKLYEIKYPIRKMHLVSDYGGSDFASIESDNTSAFNCRPVAGTNRWSLHSYGKAIDINPLENPYVSKNGYTSHKNSYKYLNRIRTNNSAAQKAMILKSDPIVKFFKYYGWRWGGDFKCCKDYQHFDKK